MSLTFIIVIVCLTALVVYLFSPDGLSEGDRARLSRMEAQTDRVLRALGVNWEEEVGVAVTKELLAVFDQWERDRGTLDSNVPPADRMIEAIKLYRRLAGVGLREAKDRVRGMAHQIQLGENRYVPRP